MQRARLLVAALAFTLAAAVAGCAADGPAGPDDRLARADELLAEGDAQGALPLYQEVLDEDAGSAAALLGLARSYSELRNFEKAEEHYFRAIATDAEDIEARLNFAGFYYRNRRYDRALEVLQEAMDADVEGEHEEIITTLWARVEPAQVRANVRRGLLEQHEADPDDAEVRAKLVESYAGEAEDLLLSKNAHESLDVVDEGIGKLPETAELYYLGAQAYRMLGRLEDSTDWVERAIALDGDVARYHLAYAGVLADTEQYNRAKEELQKVMDLAPGTEEAEFARIRFEDFTRMEMTPEADIEAYEEERRNRAGSTPDARKKKGG